MEAIQQRDAPRSRRLVLHWVHRRGLASLQSFQTTTLAAVADSEACRWLEALLVQPPIRVDDLIGAEEVGETEPPLADLAPLPQVEAAFAALAAEFATADPVPPAVEPTTEAPVPGAMLPPPPVAAALPLSFAIAAATDLAAANAARSAVEGVPQPEPSLIRPDADAADPSLPIDDFPDLEEGELPVRRRLPLPRLGRFKRLVRGCYEGTIGSLQQVVRAGSQLLPDATDAIDADGFGELVEIPAASGPAELFAAAESTVQTATPDPLESLPALEVAPIFQPVSLMEGGAQEAAEVVAAAPAPADPVAPLPAFHAPVIAGFADDSFAFGAVGSEAAAAEPAAAGVRQVRASLAFRLPRLGAAGASQRPAPAPDALADLRAWLPDDGDDLPRAC